MGDYPKRFVLLWKAIVIGHVHDLVTLLIGWKRACQRTLAERRRSNELWVTWVCDCLDSKNGMNPYMLD